MKIYVDFALSPQTRAHLESNIDSRHELIYPKNPAVSVLSLPEPEASFYSADIAFGQPLPDAIEKAVSLKWIQVSSSGITRYDTPEFREHCATRDLPICNSAAVYATACADHLLSFLLAQSRQLPAGLASHAANASDEWSALRQSSVSLQGQRLVILGYGAIGERLAQRLAPFEMEIVAYRRTPRGDETIPVIGADALPQALANTDHVVNILPHSDATENFFDAARLAQINPTAAFYNIGRGSTVDQDALAAALENQQLAAAWLDVTTPEPLPADHRLRKLQNCHITPHTAGGHRDEALTCIDHFLANLHRFETGKPLQNRVI